MTKESAFLGLPEDFHNKFLIYPPKIKEVVSNKKFSQYRQIFTFSQEELDDEYMKKDDSAPTPFEFLLMNSYNSKEFDFLFKQAFKFFLKVDVDFLYEEKIIVIGSLQDILKNIQSID